MKNPGVCTKYNGIIIMWEEYIYEFSEDGTLNGIDNNITIMCEDCGNEPWGKTT